MLFYTMDVLQNFENTNTIQPLAVLVFIHDSNKQNELFLKTYVEFI